MAEPKIKFRQNDGSNYPEWETIPMSEIFTEISEKNHPELPVLSVQQGVGTILRDSSDRNILYDKKNLSGYKAMKKDDFIIHLRSFEGGLECSNYDGISSPAYRILRPNRILSGAYRDYFRSDDFINNKLAVSVVGIRDGKNIDMDTFWQILITVPCLEEQQKIADFLGDVDTLIKTSEQELLKLKELKKGCLQKMFPRGDADVPEVRFPGFTGAWERRKLGDIVDVCSGRDYRHLSEGDVPVYGTGGYMLSVSSALSESEDAIGIGRKGTIDSPFILRAPFWTVDTLFYCILKDVYDLNFVFDIYQIVNWKSLDESTGVPSLSKTAINKVVVKTPSINEQKKIGQFFADIDNLIALHKRECEKYKELKKGLLQQMFV